MKVLIAAALMILSVPTFSAETSSVDSFLSVLPFGTYQGNDGFGSACHVTVSALNDAGKALSVSVSNSKSTQFKVINDGSEFYFKNYRKEFIQTDRQFTDSTKTSYVDKTIRTMIAGENTLYVIVATEVTQNTELPVKSVECVIKL